MNRGILTKLLFSALMSVSLLTGCTTLENFNTHTHHYSYEVIKPTCQHGGYTLYKCECGDSYETNYTEKVDHTTGSKVCDYCGLNYLKETKNLIQTKGTFISSKNVYQLTYTADKYQTHLQYEVSSGNVWLVNAYTNAGTMALIIPDAGWNCFFCYVVIKQEFYEKDMNSYSNWIVGEIKAQDIKYSNRTSLLTLTGSNIVSSLKNSANQACHEQMFIACSSLFFILLNNRCGFSNPHLGFTNWEN